MPNDQHETIDAILAEMRDERIVRLDGADTTRCLLLNLADRIEAAVNRERDAYNKIISGCEATAGDLAKERNRAVQYANAAPHPGSASWKEMQSDARKVATLRDSLVEILDRTNREKARDYDAALNGGILEIHDIANIALNETKGE
jgi:hypothetical protein